MPALTIRQPWATALVHPELPKTIETRSRRIPAKYLNVDVAIIAALHPVKQAKWFGPHTTGAISTQPATEVTDVLWFNFDRHGWAIAAPRIPLPLGAVVGVTRFVECLPICDRANYGACRGVDAWWQDNAWSLGICEDGAGPGAPRHMIEHRDADYVWGDYTPGRWAWITDPDHTRLIDPVPARGGLHWQQIKVQS
jgi:hypothetical protein